MKIIAGEIYHIYNQGSNREMIFYSHENYTHFLKLLRKFIYPHCKTLCYCLMPNHYHFLIYATADSEKMKLRGNIETSELFNGFRLLQSTYAQYINKQQLRTGSLFKQKAQSKSMSEGDKHYEYYAFHYIHQNPVRANLMSSLADWQYSSYRDYAGLRMGTICDQELTYSLIGISKENFIEESEKGVEASMIVHLFCNFNHLL